MNEEIIALFKKRYLKALHNTTPIMDDYDAGRYNGRLCEIEEFLRDQVGTNEATELIIKWTHANPSD